MAIALVAHTLEGCADGTVGSVTTSAIDTTGASLLVLWTAYAHGDTPIVSDSKGNSFSPLTEWVSDSPNFLFFLCANPVVGSGHTFTLDAGSGSTPSLGVMAFSGLSNAAADQEQGFTSLDPVGGGANTQADMHSITPSDDGALIVVGHADDTFASDPVASNDGGILTRVDTIQLNDPFGTPDHYSLATWWGVQPTAAAINVHINWGATASYAQGIAALLPAVGGASSFRRTQTLHGTRTGSRQIPWG